MQHKLDKDLVLHDAKSAEWNNKIPVSIRMFSPRPGALAAKSHWTSPITYECTKIRVRMSV